MRHTPGPWQVQITGGEVECVSGSQPGLWAVVNGPDYETRAANAQLIAAAPDLAWALERMLREHDALQMASGSTEDRWEAATYARAMLAKARGE